jgi:hypothetical protein
MSDNATLPVLADTAALSQFQPQQTPSLKFPFARVHFFISAMMVRWVEAAVLTSSQAMDFSRVMTE